MAKNSIEENVEKAIEENMEEQAETEIKENAEETMDMTRSKKIKSALLELLLYAVMLVICLLIMPRYVIQRTIVSGSSMENTLNSNDNLLVEKISYRIGDPDRFDVVVFYPYGKEADEYYVKRVIGLPGEKVQIVGNNIYINDEVIEEEFGKNPITYAGIAKEPLTLDKDEYFLMGDNRAVSFDSRYEEIGPVHRNLIAGKALLRIWPLNKFGTFK